MTAEGTHTEGSKVRELWLRSGGVNIPWVRSDIFLQGNYEVAHTQRESSSLNAKMGMIQPSGAHMAASCDSMLRLVPLVSAYVSFNIEHQQRGE